MKTAEVLVGGRALVALSVDDAVERPLAPNNHEGDVADDPRTESPRTGDEEAETLREPTVDEDSGGKVKNVGVFGGRAILTESEVDRVERKFTLNGNDEAVPEVSRAVSSVTGDEAAGALLDENPNLIEEWRRRSGRVKILKREMVDNYLALQNVLFILTLMLRVTFCPRELISGRGRANV